ncbi:MAG: hypothetical protein R2909_20640 [Gemmatimonadales bacterium]
MNVDPIPQNLVAVHDLLSEAFTLANEDGTRFTWGVAIFPAPAGSTRRCSESSPVEVSPQR